MLKSYKNKNIKALVIILELLAIGLAGYLITLPIWPLLNYKLFQQGNNLIIDWQDITEVKGETARIINHLPKTEKILSSNRLVIAKIGVNAPIIEGENSDYALDKGVWRVPETGTPEKGGNIVITGHRFKYLPPNNLTFYLLDKLARGDIVTLIWQGKNNYYKIIETKVVSSNDTSIMAQSSQPIITLYTCDPIYSQKNRLVVVAELIRE